MTTTLAKAVAAALFVLIFAFGFWLSRAGKPYNAVIFNVHKLFALGALVFMIVVVVRGAKAAAMSQLQIAAAAVMFLMIVALFATGALLSLVADGKLQTLGQSARAAILLAHRIAPWVSVAAAAGTLFL